jgi:hypothetical protein
MTLKDRDRDALGEKQSNAETTAPDKQDLLSECSQQFQMQRRQRAKG